MVSLVLRSTLPPEPLPPLPCTVPPFLSCYRAGTVADVALGPVFLPGKGEAESGDREETWERGSAGIADRAVTNYSY